MIRELTYCDEVIVTLSSENRRFVVTDIDPTPDNRDSLECIYRVIGRSPTGIRAYLEQMSTGRLRAIFGEWTPPANVYNARLKL